MRRSPGEGTAGERALYDRDSIAADLELVHQPADAKGARALVHNHHRIASPGSGTGRRRSPVRPGGAAVARVAVPEKVAAAAEDSDRVIPGRDHPISRG